MAKITGFEEVSKKLTALGAAAGGQALRSCAHAAMLPALNAARAAIPVADPPYHEGAGVRRNKDGTISYQTGAVYTVDPFPQKTYTGRLVTPGFAQRSLRRKTVLSKDKTLATAMLGVLPEAFYVLQFVELGTRFYPKHPWLEPSFRGSLPAVDSTLSTKLKQRLDIAAETGEAHDPLEPAEDAE